MKIEVTNHDIDCGDRWSFRSCPIARAIDRATSSTWLTLVVNPKHVSRKITTGSPKEEAQLPKIAEDFIFQFDSGCEVEPIAFDLDFTPVWRANNEALH